MNQAGLRTPWAPITVSLPHTCQRVLVIMAVRVPSPARAAAVTAGGRELGHLRLLCGGALAVCFGGHVFLRTRPAAAELRGGVGKQAVQRAASLLLPTPVCCGCESQHCRRLSVTALLPPVRLCSVASGFSPKQGVSFFAKPLFWVTDQQCQGPSGLKPFAARVWL